MSIRLVPVLLAAALSLTACDRNRDAAELANLDNQLVGNDVDPALTSALEDQILVDPALTQQSNKNAVRPPETPVQAQYPLPDNSAARGTGRSAAVNDDAACGANFDYNPGWARRLPAELAVYPGARITEAAGNKGDCRVVSFTSNDAPERILNWYQANVERTGYSAERQLRGGDHILAGSKGDAAYFLILTPRGRGSDVALIANNGR